MKENGEMRGVYRFDWQGSVVNSETTEVIPALTG